MERDITKVLEVLTKDSKYHLNIIIEGLLIGIVSGLIVSFYRFLINSGESIVFNVISIVKTNVFYTVLWFVILILMGLFICYLIKFEGDTAGSGVPQVTGEVKGYIDANWLKLLFTKTIGGFVSSLGGLSLGREGPSVQLGAMASKGLSKVLKAPNTDETLFILAGSGAGLAATFNAPIAGLLFTLEEIDHTFNKKVVFVGLIAAVTADFIAKIFFGQSTVFKIASPNIPLDYYWLLIILGILLGFAGYLFNRGLIGASNLWEKYNVPIELRIVPTFIICGICGFFIPQILEGGYSMVNSLNYLIPGITLILLLLIGKFLLTILSSSSGSPGGIFFPILAIGAYVGALFSAIAIPVFGLNPTIAYKFIIISMAGMFASTIRSPITGIILVTEITGSAHTLVALAIVSIIAYMIPTILNNDPIYTSLLNNILEKRNQHKYEDSTKPILANYTVPLSSSCENRKLNDIPLPDTILVISIIRDDNYIIPDEDTVLKYGDELYILMESGRFSKDNRKIEKIIYDGKV